MANDRSPESVGERTMFAPDAAPFHADASRHRSGHLQHRAESLSFRPCRFVKANAVPPDRAVGAAGVAFWRSRALALWRNKPVLPSRAAIARAVRLAVSTELDRGIAFILAPVFLAVGALVYFSLGHEPGLPAARRRRDWSLALLRFR